MSKFYIFDVNKSNYTNLIGEAITLSDYINFLASTKSCDVQALNLADSISDLDVKIKSINTPIYVFNDNFHYVGSFNQPDCLPSHIMSEFCVEGKTHRCIELYIDIEGSKRVIKGYISFSDEVTTCGRTYPVSINWVNACLDCLYDFDLDIAEEAIFQSICEGECICFFDDFSYKLYDLK